MNTNILGTFTSNETKKPTHNKSTKVNAMTGSTPMTILSPVASHCSSSNPSLIKEQYSTSFRESTLLCGFGSYKKNQQQQQQQVKEIKGMHSPILMEKLPAMQHQYDKAVVSRNLLRKKARIPILKELKKRGHEMPNKEATQDFQRLQQDSVPDLHSLINTLHAKKRLEYTAYQNRHQNRRQRLFVKNHNVPKLLKENDLVYIIVPEELQIMQMVDPVAHKRLARIRKVLNDIDVELMLLNRPEPLSTRTVPASRYPTLLRSNNYIKDVTGSSSNSNHHHHNDCSVKSTRAGNASAGTDAEVIVLPNFCLCLEDFVLEQRMKALVPSATKTATMTSSHQKNNSICTSDPFCTESALCDLITSV